MLILFLSLFFLTFLPISNAGCPTSPFCESYPECTRDCLGAHTGNVPFFHSYGTDMAMICSTGEGLAAHYNNVFTCISENCTEIANRQKAWDQLVDDCASQGFAVDSSLKPIGYSAHVPSTVSPSQATSAPTGTGIPTITTSNPSTTSTTGSAASSSDGLTKAAEIGTIVGAICGVIFLGIGVWQCWKYEGRHGG